MGGNNSFNRSRTQYHIKIIKYVEYPYKITPPPYPCPVCQLKTAAEYFKIVLKTFSGFIDGYVNAHIFNYIS